MGGRSMSGKYSYEKVLVSPTLDLESTASEFQFSTSGYSRVSWEVVYATGTPVTMYTRLLVSATGSNFQIAKTVKADGSGITVVAWVDEVIRNFSTYGKDITATTCKIKVKTAENAEATGKIHVYLAP
jgi:hypothetical protein